MAGACLAASAAFAITLLADLYARYGAELRAVDAQSPVAEQASALAVQLAPRNSGYRADYAWSLAARGNSAATRNQYRLALRLDPANPYRWIEYEQLLSRLHQFDDELAQAASRVVQLAPNSRPIQLHNAWMGVNYWAFGDDDTRRAWSRSIVNALRQDTKFFLQRTISARRDEAFCGFVGPELGLDRWCQAVAWARPICESLAQDEKKSAPWCRDLGLSR